MLFDGSPVTLCNVFVFREVHSVCSWDEKSSVKIHKALEQEITFFISEAQKVMKA
jgi:hypothetical protein